MARKMLKELDPHVYFARKWVRTDFDETKYTYFFLIKDDELWEKYYEI